MPKSRVRPKAAYTPPPRQSLRKKQSPPWVGAGMVGCFLVGVAWLAIFYITNGSLIGLRSLGELNLLIAFAFIIAGFVFATRWR